MNTRRDSQESRRVVCRARSPHWAQRNAGAFDPGCRCAPSGLRCV